MCGINGIFGLNKIEAAEKRIRRMNRSLAHRGPDADRFEILEGGRLALGHRRLAILDRGSRSGQPMTSASQRWTIVYNGEIYNYQELKKKVDYPFQTASDTEVILAFVENFGVDEFLGQCNGMFAMALYDAEEKFLYLIRDRVGIKPLYYYLDGEKLIFSSEVKGILQSGLVDAKFNEDAVDEYLGYRYVREPYTFFRRVLQLEAGTYMKISGSLEKEAHLYWELPEEFNMRERFNESEIAWEFEKRLTASIRQRMIADVSLGTYLSGGIDSSLITAVAARNTEESVNTFTIGFDGQNEFYYADLVAQRYSTNHHELLIAADEYFGMLEEVIRYRDAPLGVPNEILLAKMSRILKKDITVVLSGEGADELLGGYGRIFRSPFDYENRGGPGQFYTYLLHQYEYVPRALRDQCLSVDAGLREAYDEKIRREFQGRGNEENVFRFFHRYHVKGLLGRVDTTTMLAGVEARVPFLDHSLIEFTYREVPYDLKLHWRDPEAAELARGMSAEEYSEVLDQPKYLLRKIAAGYLPEEVIERKKVGFPVPLSEWMGRMEGHARATLQDAAWLRRDSLKVLMEESRKNARAGQILWMFVNLERFRKMYFEKSWRY